MQRKKGRKGKVLEVSHDNVKGCGMFKGIWDATKIPLVKNVKKESLEFDELGKIP